MEGAGLSVVVAVLLVMAARCGAQSDEELAALCSQIGVVPHPFDSTKYVTCATGQGGFVARERSCGGGETFDGISCVFESVFESEVPRSFLLESRANEPSIKGECEDKTFNCADCNTILRCRKMANNLYTKISNINCTANTPHCNLGKCSDKISDVCKVSAFRCQIDVPGIFPDTASCKGFYVCDGKREKPIKYTPCSDSKLFFSSIQNDCIASKDGCSAVVCAPKYVGYQAYAADPRYYVFCDPTDPMIDMYRCPGETKLKIVSATEAVCISGCTSAGKIPLPSPLPDPLPKEYEGKDHLVCAGPNDLNPVPSKCPEGLKFNARLNRCDLPGDIVQCNIVKHS